MIDIVEQIDNWTTSQYPEVSKKLFGLCDLIKNTTGTPPGEQPMVVRIIDGVVDRRSGQVALDDKFNLVTWIRKNGPITPVENEDDQWGIKDRERYSIPLRWVIAHKIQLGETWIIELLRDFPDRFTIDGYDFVFVNKDFSVDTDHESIYETELGKSQYEKHRFDWNLYAIEMDVEYILCPVTE